MLIKWVKLTKISKNGEKTSIFQFACTNLKTLRKVSLIFRCRMTEIRWHLETCLQGFTKFQDFAYKKCYKAKIISFKLSFHSKHYINWENIHPHHMSHVTCHVSYVKCHMLFVQCDIFCIFFPSHIGASWWRVCFQRGLPRLVLKDIFRLTFLLQTTH